MFSVPSPRRSLGKWLYNQGYDQVGSIPYPAKYLGHELIEGAEDAKLEMHAKSLTESKPEPPVDFEAQGKDSGDSKKPVEQPPQRNMHLPPHWRGHNADTDTPPPPPTAATAAAAAASVDINIDALKTLESCASSPADEDDDEATAVPGVD
jgi:hypothetical protein